AVPYRLTMDWNDGDPTVVCRRDGTRQHQPDKSRQREPDEGTHAPRHSDPPAHPSHRTERRNLHPAAARPSRAQGCLSCCDAVEKPTMSPGFQGRGPHSGPVRPYKWAPFSSGPDAAGLRGAVDERQQLEGLAVVLYGGYQLRAPVAHHLGARVPQQFVVAVAP